MKALMGAWDERTADADREPSSAEALGDWLVQERTTRGLTSRRLAERARCSVSLISQIEHGVVSPSLATLERICRALGVTLSDCIAGLGEPRGLGIVRRVERRTVTAVWSQARLEALGPAVGVPFTSRLITVDPGGRSSSGPAAHPTDEFAFVLLGSLVLTLRGEEHEIHASDAVTLPARELRLWENRTTAPAKVLVVAGCR